MAIGSVSGVCPCVNVTGTFASFTDRYCELPNGQGDGIQLTVGGSCVPFSYGSSRCLQHDLLYDPNCAIDKAGDRIIDAYCVRPFCYVDAAMCKRETQERVFRSSYFSFDSGVDIFYSYSTCNSTAEDWFSVEDDIVGGRTLGAVSIDAVIPTYVFPMHYKKDPFSEEVLFRPGNEFYDDNIPYEGIYITYIKKIQEVSGGDIQNINFTHRSQASSLVHPGSSFTAAVQDLEDGLVDMAVGPFWITAQRLRMSSFTLPLVYDKTFLVIPKPGTKETLNAQIGKVLAPLSMDLWWLLIGFTVITALLSVWFSDRSDKVMNEHARQAGLQRNMPRQRRRKRVYARLALDACLQKGGYFFSAGVEQDESATLSNKLLLFGFGFFILISVSAYVANLAAFLTLSATESVRTIDEAVATGVTICAHIALKVELEVAWPDAKFHFNEHDTTFEGILNDHAAKICDVMAVGYEDSILDTAFLQKMCDLDLVYTDSVVVEIPIAFPIRADLASAFSYHMYRGERSGVTLQTAKDEFPQENKCNVHISQFDVESSDYDEIGIKNMFFPIVFFSTCAVLAVILQIIHICSVRSGRESLVGARSTLNLISEVTDAPPKRRKSLWAQRLSSGLSAELKEFDSEEEQKEEEKMHNFDGATQSLHEYLNENGPSGRITSTKSLMTGTLSSNGEAGALQLDIKKHPRVTFSNDE